jgi:hypothetical protein
MRHCGLDGEDHVGLQRSGRVIALISPRLVVGQAWRLMTDEAHAMRHKIQIYPVGRGVHKLVGRRENLSPCSAAADRAARPRCWISSITTRRSTSLASGLPRIPFRHKSPI